MLKKFVSFIVATKNREKYIPDLIDSFISQNDERWEAIIVNDHGSDKTKKIIERYGDDRLRYYELLDDHGHGASCARNFGAVMSECDILAIMDDDDICYPDRVSITIEAFNNNPKLDVFYGSIDIWEEELGTIRDRKTPIAPATLKRMKKEYFIPHPTVALRKQVLLDNPYNQFFRYAEDYDLMSRLMSKGYNFSYTNKKLIKYRIAGQNISIGKDREKIVDQYCEIVKMSRGWKERNSSVIEGLQQ